MEEFHVEQVSNLIENAKREIMEVWKALDNIQIVDEAILQALRNSEPFKVHIEIHKTL